MRKVILLITILFLLSGCDVRSNITINKDLSVKEEVRMTGTSSFFSVYYKDLPITVVENMLETGDRKDKLIKNGYTYTINEDERYPAVIAKKEYSSINDFVEKTIFKDQYFSNFETTNNENLITIHANGFKKYVEDPEYYEIKKFSLYIKVPYVVTDSNADSYEAATNTYIWNINEDTEDKEIKLTFDKNKIYIYNIGVYISIIILVVLGIILGLIIRMLYIKNKNNNKIVE